MRMRSLVFLLILAVVAYGAYAQTKLTDFPAGTTTMAYRITTDKLTTPQTLTLTVTGLPEGRYQIKMTTEATGTPDELGVFGFLFGATSVASGMANVDFGPISALLAHRSDLTPNEDYILPGGGTFHAGSKVTIAGISCLSGVYIDPTNPDTRTALAFSLVKPVFVSPLIKVEEKQSGKWVTTFLLELTAYSFTSTAG